MYHASIPLKLINRLPTPILNLQSPYQKLFHKPPNYSKLRILGCLCYSWLRSYSSNKLEPRSCPCIFVGYSNEHHSYCCHGPKTTKIFTLGVMPPTQHTVSSEGVIFFFFNKLITFKLVHSYNVKHLTCIIFYNNGLQNIYKLHIWKCSTFTIFTLFTKTKHIKK